MRKFGTGKMMGALLAGAAALAVPEAIAGAQDNDATSARDTIVVTATPIRDSQQAALAAKRAADNVVDIIAADTIGRFPDQNLADSLGRLPGLAIERDQGQARYINFRGAPFRYTSIAFDGIEVPGAENGRIPRFDAFPSVMTSAVEANKAITSDMPGEAVAGFINIRTFNPFDREGFTLSTEAGFGEQQLGGGQVEKYNARLSYSTDTFGVLVFGSHNGRDQVTDNRELDLEIDQATGGVIPNSLDFRSYFVDRDDNAYGGHVEFRPQGGAGNGVSRIFASTLYSEFIDEEQRNQYVFDLGASAGGLFDLATNTPYVGGALTPNTGALVGVPVRRMLEFGRYANSTFANTIGVDLDVAGWRAEARLNYTKTENETFLPIPLSIQDGGGAVVSVNTPSVTYDLTNPEAPVLNLFQTGLGASGPFATDVPFDLQGADYLATIAYLINFGLEVEVYKAKLDLEHDLDMFGTDATVKFGGQVDLRDASGGSALTTGGLPGSIDVASFATDTLWSSDFNNSIGAAYYDNEGLRSAWDDAVGGLVIPFADESLIGIEENIYSGYAMMTHDFDRGSLAYGVRVEATDYTSEGTLVIDGVATPSSTSDDFVNALPSIHLNYEVVPDLMVRASASTGLSRPTYTEWRASATVNPTDETVVGGSPDLDPETTWGGDVSVEWYYAPASLLSAGAFYRHIDDVIYADATTVDGGAYLPSASGDDWTLTGFVNGGEGFFQGVEVNFIGSAADLLPEPFDGFGVSGNVTLLESEFDTVSGASFSLPGTSDLIYNASIYYEKFGFSARLNYQFRDEWLSTTENDSLGEYWAEQKRLDFSVRYVPPVEFGGGRVTLFANGNNLTDETDVRYIQTRQTPNQVEAYGRYWLAGVRFDF